MAGTIKIFIDGSAPQCSADDLNGFKLENSNLIESSGQTLSGTDHTQTKLAIAQYAVDGDFYTVGGTANAITLTAVSPRQKPFALSNGSKVRFKAASTNTTAVTINFASFGVKSIKKNGFADDLSAGDIETDKIYEIVYDSSSDAWELVNLSDTSGINAGTQVVGVEYIQNLIASQGVDTDHDMSIDRQNTTYPANILVTDGSNYKYVTFDNTAIIKATDATWVAGKIAGTGGLADGVSLSSGLTLNMFILYNSTLATFEAGFDTSLTAANLLADSAVIAAGFDYASVVPVHILPPLDTSNNILGHVVYETEGGGIDVNYSFASATQGIEEFTDSDLTASYADIALTVPSGVKIRPFLFTNVTQGGLYLLDKNTNLERYYNVNNGGASSAIDYSSMDKIYTNTSAQIQAKKTGGTIKVSIYGYNYRRRP